MILLVTDFGLTAPYQGQLKAVLERHAPGLPVIDLLADAPAFRPRPAAYLLAALAESLPRESVFLCVVDPGVGGERAGLVVRAGGRWFVGPDNGLLAIAARRAATPEAWAIVWRPRRPSPTFHGRDIFAPVAAGLARGETPPGDPVDTARLVGADWPEDLARIVYIDGYGNAMTGLRAGTLAPGAALRVAGRTLPRARTFSDLPAGEPFWYENSCGLAEIAVNQGRADAALGLAVEDPVDILAAPAAEGG